MLIDKDWDDGRYFVVPVGLVKWEDEFHNLGESVYVPDADRAELRWHLANTWDCDYLGLCSLDLRHNRRYKHPLMHIVFRAVSRTEESDTRVISLNKTRFVILPVLRQGGFDDDRPGL